MFRLDFSIFSTVLYFFLSFNYAKYAFAATPHFTPLHLISLVCVPHPLNNVLVVSCDFDVVELSL
jgi:hypothetical protein